MKQTNIEIATELKSGPSPRKTRSGMGSALWKTTQICDGSNPLYFRSGQKSLLASIMSSRTSLATVMDGTVLLSVKAWSAFS